MGKDHLVILLESIDSKVQMLMEAVLALNQKLDKKVDRLRTDLKQECEYGSLL